MINRLLPFLASIILSCSSSASEKFNKIDESVSGKDFFDEACSVAIPVYFVEDSVWKWVQPSDVSELMDRIDSDLFCRSFDTASSSFIWWDGSTMDDEASLLIEGFRQCEHPPGLASKPLSDGDRAALKEWWSRSDLPVCGVNESNPTNFPENAATPPKWDNAVEQHLAAATQLSPDAPNQVGDVVVYGVDKNADGNLKTADGDLILHVARVTVVDDEGNTVRVQGKESDGPITDHHPSDQNKALGNFKVWFRKK